MKHFLVLLTLSTILFAQKTVQVESVYATSSDNQSSSSVYNLFDKDNNTLWKTAQRTGPEEGIMMVFRTPVLIDELVLHNLSRGSKNTSTYSTYVNGKKVSLKSNRNKVKSLFIKFDGHPQSTFKIKDKAKPFRVSSTQPQKSVSIGEISLLKGGLPYNIKLPTLIDSKVTASTTLSPETAYGVDNLFDSRKEFTWCEGAKSDGVNESITFAFSTAQKITGIQLWNGYQRSPKHFTANGRVKVLKVITDSGAQLINVKDLYGDQELTLTKPVTTKSIRLEIVEIYKGTKYADLCISELNFIDGNSLVTIDRSKNISQRRNTTESKYANTYLGSLLNSVITKSITATGEGDFNEEVTLILRSDNTFVYYSDLSEVYSGEAKNVVADGNWKFVSTSGNTQTIKLFGQWLNISEISEMYSGTSKSSYQRIFQDKITISIESFSSDSQTGIFKRVTSSAPAKAYRKNCIKLSGGKFLTPLFYSAE